MKIVTPWANIVSDNTEFGTGDPQWMTPFQGKNLLRKIEWAARVSHRSEDKMTSESYDRILRDVVMRKGDFSVIEHATVTVMMYHDRGIQQELTRHRPPSYTIESTRFVNYETKMEPSFIYPKPEIECPYCLGGNAPFRESVHDEHWTHRESGLWRCAYDETWLGGIDHAERVYRGLIRKGWRPQEARSVFPLSLGSLMVITTNLRQWRHVMLMRTTKETHPSFRQVSIPLLAKFKETIPILFEDIEPLASQAENLKKMR